MSNKILKYKISGNLKLNYPHNKNDVARLAEFNGSIHGEGISDLTHRLMEKHPSCRREYFIYLEDTLENRIVSSLCLIPWELNYCGIKLKTAEMGIVGTSPDYRGLGLCGLLTEKFDELVVENGFDLSLIKGIPNFYRRFGYEYAIPLDNDNRLEPDAVPIPGDYSEYRFVPANMSDIPYIIEAESQELKSYGISAIRDESVWNYLFDQSVQSETAIDRWIVYKKNERKGYFGIARQGLFDGLILSEGAISGLQDITAALAKIKEICIERKKPYIRLDLPVNNPIVITAIRYNCKIKIRYACQIKIYGFYRFLQKIKPVLEDRVSKGIFAGLTGSKIINLYGETIGIEFSNGRIAEISEEKGIPYNPGITGVYIPPGQFMQMIMGYKSPEEVSSFYPDFQAGDEEKALLAVLFPKMDGYIYSIY